jgi:hypothetical protein
MTIEFDDSIRAVWYVQLNAEADWMCGLNKADDGFRVQYRFRYYETLGAWDGLDRKNWYRAELKGESPDQVIEAMRKMIAVMQDKGAGQSFELVRDADETVEAFLTRFTAMPFAHKRTLTKEEWEAEQAKGKA